ncbi:MAG: hypothetical protein PHQ90_05740 [Sulfuricurvum sp.]|uniref:hypothetical protein n=1 Tax=Sulfuricurvum sp. TaxID=2025608 RepID=UPI002613CAF8|nr:hypothetical protein [Sulfuricurvum sp.]MDD2368786.1 hypothetical protein [Sulfuricurvum sp.]MDD2949746.1 hypothetical protein [Sulfuricurvum sp.]MDD5117088.1 hypothetical protein [Sulfuricurvum sp.]
MPRILKIFFVTLLLIAMSSLYAQCTATTYPEVAEKIAYGHSWEKHRNEFTAGIVMAGLAMPSSVQVTNVKEFESHILSIISSSTNKSLSNGRRAFWDYATGTIVFYDPYSNDCGTAFRPTAGKQYFDRQR